MTFPLSLQGLRFFSSTSSSSSFSCYSYFDSDDDIKDRANWLYSRRVVRSGMSYQIQGVVQGGIFLWCFFFFSFSQRNVERSNFPQRRGYEDMETSIETDISWYIILLNDLTRKCVCVFCGFCLILVSPTLF